MKTKRKASGFFIVEILIVLLIVGILAIALLPNLAVYVKKAKFSDVITAANAAKPLVEFCLLKNNGDIASCDTIAQVGITQTTADRGNLASGSPEIEEDTATITATGIAAVDSATYTLTPTYNAADNTITWVAGGTCGDLGLC